MRPTLLTTVLLLSLLTVASLGYAILSPRDAAAWITAEAATILAVLFGYFYLHERT